LNNISTCFIRRVIKYSLGGNYRLMSYNNLKLQENGLLKKAEGANANSFF
jgi:hypothetical protein